MNLDKALAIAIQAHKGQVDKAGEPYILHPLRLMSQFADKDLMTVSILHDVVEDSDFTLKNLVDAGFSPIIIDAVDCLTKRENEEYANFIERVIANPLAIKVKIADIKDNLNISRLCQPLSEKDIDRLKKYQIALLRLQQMKDDITYQEPFLKI
jgi:(p)ppGpp synthase/HD superfamily hydrolase